MKNKSYIFNKSFEEIFTKERISFTITKLKLNEELKEFEGDNIFGFLPHYSFLIPKNLNEFRKISIPSAKLRVIQTILSEELSYKLKFSDRSYAYRKNKGSLKAINRVKHIIKNFEFIIKIDIKSFFDTINHTILINKKR